MDTTFHGTLPGTTGTICIRLDALKRNWQSLAKRVAPAECAAVVKADAYGLGARQVVTALIEAGCRTFFVATLPEAQDIKSAASGARIFILDGILGDSARDTADAGCIPVLSTPDDIAAWTAHAKAIRCPLPAALHIDTGLNRLGLGAADVQYLVDESSRLAGIELDLIMSHLACADEPEADMNRQQLAKFRAARKILPAVPASLAASDGLMLGDEFHFDLVRPGYALYGGQAFQGAPTPVEPVISVTARLLQVRELKAGDQVGYSGLFRAPHAMKIAIISAGYADGLPRSASAADGQTSGAVAIGGHRAPIVGRVSMDLVSVDVSALPEHVLAGADEAELVGSSISLEEAGRAAGTIGYEILTRLSRRFQRHYVET